jgi:hypothetical protein
MSPPEAFLNFCLVFDIALSRDRDKYRGESAERWLDESAAYALQWHDHANLQSLGSFLDSVFSASAPEALLQDAWSKARPNVAFYATSSKQNGGGITYVFKRVRAVIASKLNEK